VIVLLFGIGSKRPNPFDDSKEVDPEAGRRPGLCLVGPDVPGDTVGAGVAIDIFRCHGGCHPGIDGGRARPLVEIARAHVLKGQVRGKRSRVVRERRGGQIRPSQIMGPG
jgi:hypothetical protein